MPVISQEAGNTQQKHSSHAVHEELRWGKLLVDGEYVLPSLVSKELTGQGLGRIFGVERTLERKAESQKSRGDKEKEEVNFPY